MTDYSLRCEVGVMRSKLQGEHPSPVQEPQEPVKPVPEPDDDDDDDADDE